MSDELQNLKPATQLALTNALNAMELPESVEEVKLLLERGEKEGIKQSYRNSVTILQADPLLRGAIRYNMLTTRVEITKSLGWARTTDTLTDTDVNYLLLYFEENYGLTIEKKINKAISIAANENRCHPIQDTLNSLEWDGQERIRYALHHFLGAEANDYTYEAFRMFLLGAIKRVFQPGCKFDMMLCLSGGQGAGKSTFFRFLAIQDNWFSDDIRKLDDENIYRCMEGHWIMEMSEMLATDQADNEVIKSFLSRQKDNYKTPYDRHPADRPRQCVFGGTTNLVQFLPLDRSGNRRFVPVLVSQEQSEVHILADEQSSRAYILQVWAEAMTIYRSGKYELKFTPDTENYFKEYQQMFMQEDTTVGQILGFLEKYRGDMVCSYLLFCEAMGNPTFKKPSRKESGAIYEIMSRYAKGWRYFKNPRYFKPPYNRQKGWERITAVNQTEGFTVISEKEAQPLGMPSEWLAEKEA